MSTSLVDSYRRWFEYEKDAHAKVVLSLETVPVAGKSTPAYRKAIDLLAHLAGARRMWLGRLGVAPPIAGPLFPVHSELPEVVAQLQQTQELWTNYLAALEESDLERVFEYQSLDAGRFRNRVADILTQLFGHSWYHRGQMAMLVRRAGGEPAITDLVYWCREPAEVPQP
jgi:uncharacterized damage-inducible protein DinB